MGQEMDSSLISEFRHNSFLTKLSQKQAVQFYKCNAREGFKRLSYLTSEPTGTMLPCLNQKIIEDDLFKHVSSICRNNRKTGALNGIILSVCGWLESSKKDEDDEIHYEVDHIVNGLFVLRNMFHYIIVNSKSIEHDLEEQLSKFPQNMGRKKQKGRGMLDYLIRTSFIYLNKCSITENNFFIHDEILNIFVVLMSTTLYYGIHYGEGKKGNEQMVGYDGDSERSEESESEEEGEEKKENEGEKKEHDEKEEDGEGKKEEEEEESVSKGGEEGEEPQGEVNLPETRIEIVDPNRGSKKKKKKGGKFTEIPLDPQSRSGHLFMECMIKGTSRKDAEGFVLSMLQNILHCEAIRREEEHNELHRGYFSQFVEFLWNLPDLAMSMLSGSKLLGEQERVSRYDGFCVKSLFVLENLLFYRKNSLPSVFMDAFSTLEDADFNFLHKIFSALCKDVTDEAKSVLLYLLVLENEAFRTFMMEQDVRSYVLPLLECLHSPQDILENNFGHHSWILVIVLMILTKDAGFNAKLNEVRVTPKDVPWFQGQSRFASLPLSSLLIAVLCELIKRTFSRKKGVDTYLNNNCLCVIGNVSAYVENMGVLTSQKFFDLVSMIHKKFEKIPQEEEDEDELDDKASYYSYLQICVEITNSILSTKFPENPNFVYQMILEKQTILDVLSCMCDVEEAENVYLMLEYLTQVIKKEEEEKQITSWQKVDDVMVLFSRVAAKKWRENLCGMASLSQLKYDFKEEKTVEDFFVPYLWALLILHEENMNWETEFVKLDLPFISDYLRRGEEGEEGGHRGAVEEYSSSTTTDSGEAENDPLFFKKPSNPFKNDVDLV